MFVKMNIQLLIHPHNISHFKHSQMQLFTNVCKYLSEALVTYKYYNDTQLFNIVRTHFVFPLIQIHTREHKQTFSNILHEYPALHPPL